MSNFWSLGEIAHLIVFQVLLLVVILSNIALLRRARQHALPPRWPRVSILVPARDEAGNIRDCARSLLAQDYPDFELLVLDDQSSDGTRVILDALATDDARLRVLVGSPTPENMLGKNWACAQLARQAGGELLLFTDADTRHAPGALRALVAALLGENADLLSGFPRQEVGSWGERLLVPFFSWATLAFIPLWLAYRLRLPALSSAVGQILLFRRAAYEQIGGHTALGLSPVDDLALARHVKASGLRWRLAAVADLVTCRMYRSGREAFEGFSKNYFAAFGSRLLPFLFVFAWLLMLFWLPFVLLVLRTLGADSGVPVEALLLCAGLGLLTWMLPYIALRLPARLALLYPLVVLASAVVALRSLVLSITGCATWKDRAVAPTGWRWL